MDRLSANIWTLFSKKELRKLQVILLSKLLFSKRTKQLNYLKISFGWSKIIIISLRELLKILTREMKNYWLINLTIHLISKKNIFMFRLMLINWFMPINLKVLG